MLKMEARRLSMMEGLRVLCIIAVLSSIFCDDVSSKDVTGRKLTTALNPGCDVPQCHEGINGSFSNIAYIKAEGRDDTLHYILSDVRVPTVLVVRGKPGSKMSINWSNLLSDNVTERADSITLDGEELSNSFAVVFTQMLEYDDIDDDADLTAFFRKEDKSLNYTFHQFEDYSWQRVMSVKENRNSAVFNHTVMKNESGDVVPAGSLSFSFNLFEADGRGDLLPKLEYNLNNTLVDILLNNLTVMYNQSRFAMETVLLGTSTEKHAITETKSLDDEYTPGVFKMFDWSTNPTDKKYGGYLEWKPICYTASDRTRLSGTFVNSYTLTSGKNQSDYILKSVAYAYFGDRVFKELSMSGNNISFGLTGDGYYVKKNYTVWTSTVGYGTPPEDAISVLVIGVISAGLGIPVIIIIFGGVYVCVKRKSQKSQVMSDFSSSYSRINT